MEEFEAMPRRMQLFYMASEIEEGEHSVRHDTFK